MAVDGSTKEKKKKKKVKSEVQDAGDANVTVCHDVSVQTGVKKEEPLEVNIRDGEKLGSNAAGKKKRMKKKAKEKEEANGAVCCDASIQTTVKTESSNINVSEAPEKTKKKKKKKVKEKAEEIQKGARVGEDGGCLVSKKPGYEEEVDGAKKKKKKKTLEVKEEADLGHDVEMVKKKKKKRTIDDVAEQEPNTGGGEMKKKRKKQKEAGECEKKVKKKGKKKSSVEEEPDEISSNKKKKKEKKKSKKLEEEVEGVDEGEGHACGGQERSPDEKTRKTIRARTERPAGKKRSKDGNKAPVTKKKLKEEHHQVVVDRADVVFLSARPGNQDEVSIDQSLGQWDTAHFDSSERQAKFLRLMGGFKKSGQPLTGSSGQANMALGKEGQRTLQQGLLGEFERAQSRHMDFRNKGVGLGFAAPSNKKFAIDVNARNSVRFDD
ncbi:lysine-rich nucleolar protein 1 isoform X2 [Puntigrus tetrazona]|uniref:lysine-rich nucleolar protein 1 isoform X2 n=1 Tax=Puntigrus tetrazona TaxID=1606681 RepID=UPI001C892891|nr:lysine-rich nucleolar protein 1 isoform X2 [Puntigrus tetrazona]